MGLSDVLDARYEGSAVAQLPVLLEHLPLSFGSAVALSSPLLPLQVLEGP